MKRTLATLGLAMGLTAMSAVAEPVNLQPGQWSYDMTFSVPGMNIPETKESDSDCMGEWESQLEPTELAKEFAGGANCTANNVSQSANRVSFDLSCPGEAMQSAKMVLTHNYNTFKMDGDVMLNIGEGQTIPSKLVVNARRTGTCTG